jgi:hypothetical protein
MTPAHPPLPTAWNFPFHPLASSQTSTLMSESVDGFSVADTRQNAGSFLNVFAVPALPASPGGRKLAGWDDAGGGDGGVIDKKGSPAGLPSLMPRTLAPSAGYEDFLSPPSSA